jgi:hypothetical protein
MDLTHSLPSILTNIMTDYLPPTGFKHAPSPALDYAQLPAREVDTKLLAQAKEEAEKTNQEQANMEVSEIKEKDAASKRASIGPFGECVPIEGGINDEDVHRVQFYADNDALKIPMVSPIFDKKHLRELPRLLVVSRFFFMSKPRFKKKYVAMWNCREITRRVCICCFRSI